MSDIEKLTEETCKFRDARDWKQFHNPKDCSLSLALEAAEVMEHFQWKSKEEVEKYLETNKNDVAEELADVMFWVLLMSHDLDIDIQDVYLKKLEKNAAKYPVEKAWGSNKKYTQF